MFRIVVLSCLLAGISGLSLDLRVGLAQPAPEVTTVVAPTANENELIPVPNVTEAKASQGPHDAKYFLYTIKLNWYQAMELCFQMGQRLATFDTEVEYNQLVNVMRQTTSNDLTAAYWTAGSDLGEKGKYVWMSTGKALNYVNWYPGEPNHAAENERCIDIRAEFHYKMNDNGCTKTQFVACEAV